MHDVAARLRLVQRVEYRLRLVLDARQHVAELAELGLDRAEHLPHLAGTLFERQRAKAHLQRIEDGEQSRRASQRNAVSALQPLHQVGPAQHFGIQPFGRQEEDREVGGVRRRDVLFLDGFRLQPDARFQGSTGQLCGHRVGALLRIEQALVVLVRKLGVDRQPQRIAFCSAAGQPDCEVHRVTAAWPRCNLCSVLVDGEHLLQQGPELRLAEDAARLHVSEQVLEVAHALRQRLHFTQSLVYLLEPVGHLLEAFAETRLQGALQLFVDGLAHLVKLGGVALLKLRKLRFHRRPHLGQTARVRLRQALQLGVERVRQRLLQHCQLLPECIDLRVLRASQLGALL